MRFRLFFLLMIVGLSRASAQIGYGAEIGAGMSTFHFAPATAPILYTSGSASALVSAKIGGLIDIPLNTHVYFQSGIYLSQKGGKRSFSAADTTSWVAINQTITLGYIELPLAVIIKTSEQGYGRFIFGISSVPAYMVTGRYSSDSRGLNPGGPFDVSSIGKLTPDKEFHAFDISLLVTAGYELPGGLFFRGYFESGVNNLSYGTEITKNRMFGISAGRIMGKGRSIKKKRSDLIDITPDDHQ